MQPSKLAYISVWDLKEGKGQLNIIDKGAPKKMSQCPKDSYGERSRTVAFFNKVMRLTERCHTFTLLYPWLASRQPRIEESFGHCDIAFVGRSKKCNASTPLSMTFFCLSGGPAVTFFTSPVTQRFEHLWLVYAACVSMATILISGAGVAQNNSMDFCKPILSMVGVPPTTDRIRLVMIFILIYTAL